MVRREDRPRQGGQNRRKSFCPAGRASLFRMIQFLNFEYSISSRDTSEITATAGEHALRLVFDLVIKSGGRMNGRHQERDAPLWGSHQRLPNVLKLSRA